MAVLSGQYYSRARVGFQSFTAILPVDLPSGDEEPADATSGLWPTLYLLHGFSGNRNDWLLRSDIETWAGKHRIAVIMPDGANRFYLDNEETGEQYGTFVGKELVDVTRRMFPLSRERKDTVIGGMSMGGYGAIRNGLLYTETFGAIIALSSALILKEVAAMTPEGGGNFMAPYGYYRHTFGELSSLIGSDKDPDYLTKLRLREGKPTRLFLACGTEDFLYERNVEFHNELTQMGYPHTWWAQAGAHDFTLWNQAMPAALEWLAQA